MTTQDEKWKPEWIEEDSNGVKKKILEIPAFELDVTWGSDERYWKKPANLQEALELKQVAWLEVKYSKPIEFLQLQSGKTYKVNFKVSMKPETAFGWNGCPVFLKVNVGSSQTLWRRVDLSSLTKKKIKENIPADDAPLTFTIPTNCDRKSQLSLGMYEVWKGRWKGGLVIHRVIITPI